MGFRYNDNAVICPLFVNAVIANKKFLGVECEAAAELNLGFEITRLIRFKNTVDFNDWLDLLCKYNYHDCPYYKEYCRESGVDSRP